MIWRLHNLFVVWKRLPGLTCRCHEKQNPGLIMVRPFASILLLAAATSVAGQFFTSDNVPPPVPAENYQIGDLAFPVSRRHDQQEANTLV
jgi:hypothetical protein